MADTLVLDTNVFSAKGFTRFLADHPARKVLPAVAAAEYYYHVVTVRGWTPVKFLGALRELGVTIERLDAHLALAAVDAAGKEFPERPSDALIAAHALLPGRLLVTSNLAHFPQVTRKTTPADLMAAR